MLSKNHDIFWEVEKKYKESIFPRRDALDIMEFEL